MKSLSQCLRTLILAAGGNGNLLFNVGPMPDGRIEPRQVERLKEMGEWLTQYGQSIYGTRGGPFRPGNWGASTRKGNQIYVHAFQWDGDALRLPAIGAKVVSARVLTGGQVDYQQTDSGLTLRVPAADHRAIDTVIALEVDRPAIELAPVRVGGASASLGHGAKARASNVFQGSPQFGPDKAVDDDLDTRWATDGGTKQAWLELALAKPVTFSRVAIHEWAGGGERIQEFEVQYRNGNEWKTLFTGTTVGPDFKKRFPAVTARAVRLNISRAIEGPTIDEFELLK